MILQGSECFCHKPCKTGSLFLPQKPLFLAKNQQITKFLKHDWHSRTQAWPAAKTLLPAKKGAFS
jgi:hypothetical protein